MKKNQENDQTFFEIYTKNLSLPSYTRGLNLFINSNDDVFIEFSLPKVIYGHNIYLYDPKNLTEHLERIHRKIETILPQFPQPFFWEFQRVDIVYSWKFLDSHSVLRAIAYLQGMNYPKKDKFFYDTAVMFKGSTYSVKFYSKEHEYFKNDYKIIQKTENEKAQDLLNISRGILRFEVTLRKKALQQFFDLNGTNINLSSYLTRQKIESILNECLFSVLKYKSDEVLTDIEAYERLQKKYTTSKAIRLYSFLKLHTLQDPIYRTMLNTTSRQYAFYNWNEIKKAGIGSIYTNVGSVEMTIPSEYALFFPPIGGK